MNIEVKLEDLKVEIIPEENLIMEKYKQFRKSPIKKKALEFLPQKVKTITINLEKVERVDHCFISDLIWLKKKFDPKDTEIVLTNIKSDYVKEFLKAVKVEDILNVRF